VHGATIGSPRLRCDALVINMVTVMSPAGQSHGTSYLRAYNGFFKGALRWPEFDRLWAQLQRRSDDGWYIYTVGEPPPTAPASRDQFEGFLAEIKQHLLDEHQEDYCGIVYADDHDEPSFVKIFDPNNLGMVCGSSEIPTLPGWTLSRIVPDDLEEALLHPRRRQRWWRRILGSAQ
jgi:hypothetical protein